MLNLIDSHDTNRALYVLTELGDSGLTQAKERLSLAALFQFTYVGAPMIYYGDEGALNAPSLGNGPNGPEDDPYNRAPYPWADEGGDSGVYGPADSSQVEYYTKLAHLRKQYVALRTGSFETLLTGDTSSSSTDNNTFAFARVGGGQTAVVALNNGGATNTASIPVAAYFADGTVLQDALGGATFTVSGGNVSVTLAARSGAVLLPFPALIDTTSPTTASNVSPAPNANGWNNTAPVTVMLSGSDSGSGIKELRYWVNGGSVTVVSGSSATITISAEGINTVNVRAIDNAGNISTLESRIVKIDLTQPNVGCPAPMTSSADSNCQAAIPNVAQSVTASDNLTPAGSLIITQSPTPGTMVTTGAHSITVTVTDLAGNSNACTTTFNVIDNTPPTISGVGVNPAVLSPANHKMVNVTVNYTSTDNCGAVNCTLSVSSNEPINGEDDGNTAPDWEIVDSHHVRLRAERSDRGNGRVYTITITCVDGSGNSTSRSATVTAPRN